MTKFIFDLDGTITKQETLPLIAKHFNVVDDIDKLTKQTIDGSIPFVESFINRVFILGKYPVNEISTLLSQVAIYTKIKDFINMHFENCYIATGNLDCWVDKLICENFKCKYYSSKAIVEHNAVIKIDVILKKEQIVEQLKCDFPNSKIVFIGDGNNDVEAMKKADIKIGTGLTHMPSNSILNTADYVIFEEDTLCKQLNQLL